MSDSVLKATKPKTTMNWSGSRERYVQKLVLLTTPLYVILERAVPAIEDGLKPVQQRILHSMWSLRMAAK